MKIMITENYKEMSKTAAEIIIEQVLRKPESVLGLATGSTPEGMYKYLAEAYRDGKVDFSQIRTVNLDEYVGLGGEHPQSFRYFMDSKFFNYVNVQKKNIHMPEAMLSCEDEIAERYEKALKETGRPDIQILGIGGNGHIGFNEPSEIFARYVNAVELTKETIEANARFFENRSDVPKKAVTMGIKDIMSAKRIVLMASGKNKREILAEALQGEITPKVPASILQLHPNLTVIADRDAGGKLISVKKM